MKVLIYLLTLLVSFLSFSKDEGDIIKDYQSGQLTKELALKKINQHSSYIVEDFKIISNKVIWKISFGVKTKNSNRNIASVDNRGTKLEKILSLYKSGEIKKEELLSFLQTSFPYNVVDIDKLNDSFFWEIQFGQNHKSRDIAGFINQSQTPFISNPKKSNHSFRLISSLGVVDVSRQNNSSLSMNFVKVGVEHQYKLKADYILSSAVKTNYFYSLSHSKSEETKTPSSLYPEFSIKLTKKHKHFNSTVGYDYLNYFSLSENVTTIDLSPSGVHRFSYAPSYRFAQRWMAFTSLGFLAGASDDIKTGFDFAIGASYQLDKKGKFNSSLSFYTSSVDVIDDNDQSSAVSLNFGYNF